MTGLNTLERDDLLRRIAWLNAEVDKIKRMLKGEQGWNCKNCRCCYY